MNLPINNIQSVQNEYSNNDQAILKMFYRNLKSENTRRSYKTAISTFFNFVDKPLAEITLNDIQDYLDTLKESKKTTQSQRISAISSLYSFSIKIGYLRYNPFLVVNKPKPSSRPIEKFLSEEEIKKIWEVLKEKKRNAVIGSLLITTGLRVAELCNIKMKDFFTDDYGNIGIYIYDTKGEKNREIKVRPDVFEYIYEYGDSLDRKISIPDIKNNEYLLTTRTNNRVTEDYIRKIIKNASAKAGINKNVSPHWFRHTSASLSIKNGCDIAKVTENFGWSSLKVAKRYLHNMDRLTNTSVDYVQVSLD
ncbi:MAG: tyrosine-type recombinase/integrase [Tissierellales bacterium]|jgi:integrase/recombinase XerD|nr:tyrosine-type recombinase/integrase [Tissierellales bacterium]